ncbi:MAG: protein kinase [Kiritimatiellae bacterium]|nr:protein kinase [Kiritimatiellia bacterium]
MDIPKIPGYDILVSLPQGGMSAVFKARQISLDRVVAIKMLPPSMAADVVDIEKFLAEAKTTAQLKHPNIVQVYDFGKSPDGVYYFVMEFVSGYSVADWIRRKTRLTLKDTLLCAHCVAEALNYAWENYGIVHCDIKPDNVIIDGDGTVKVADLGLARSVRSVMDKAKSSTGIVVGTPYYISPEQSHGRIELDCRTDIYSLGAMLYHCLTGKLPFEGLPLLEIMDCQITDQIPDLIDLQPQASITVACMIEKMMAKSVDYRQKNWPEVIRDMIRARADLLPEGPMPPAGASTMKRCPAREQYLKKLGALAHPVPAPKSSESAPAVTLPATPQLFTRGNRRDAPPARIIAQLRQQMKWKLLAAAIMILAIAVSGLLVMNMLFKPGHVASPQNRQPLPSSQRVGIGGPGAAEGQPAEEVGQQTTAGKVTAPEFEGLAEARPSNSGELNRAAETELAQHRLDAALQWYRENPNQYNEAIRQFAKIALELKDTPKAQIARDEIARIREQKRMALDADMKVLRDKVRPLLAQQKFREASALYEQYDGPFKTETAAERKVKVKEWLDQDKARQAEMLQAADAQVQEQRQKWRDVIGDITARLVEGNPAAALAAVQRATNNPALAANRSDLLTLASMLAEAGRADQRILDSFRSQTNQEVVVALTRGPERLVVRDVQGDKILVEKVIVVDAGQLVQSKAIRLQDLSLAEKKARLGTNATPETALMRGLVALRDGDWIAAKTSWSQAGPLLSAPLTAKLQARQSLQREDQARSDFILLLSAAQIESFDLSAAKEKSLPGCDVCVAAIYRKQYSLQAAKALATSAAGYQEQYGQTEFAQAYAPALEALKQAPVISLHSNKTANVETEPASSETGSPDKAAVRKELFACNPGLIDLNVSLVTDGAGKIVRAELISVDLKDIKPLAGLLDLGAVVCAAIDPDEWHESPVKAPLSDLSPLKGLPLKEVCVSDTRVKDISPLAGMPLTKLDLSGTRVTDLLVLKGMPLQELTLSRLSIRDLKLLVGLPLESLNISHTDVSDLTPLTGMHLKRLIASATRIRDLTVLAGMPLKELNISRTEVTDINPLIGIELKHLNLSQTRVRNLTPLASLPLRSLELSKTDIRDLSPVRDLVLESLNVHATRVKDLEPLRNMPLKLLDISNTDVRDISPLRDLPLKKLTLWKTAVRDLTPIQNSNIEEIWLDYDADQQSYVDTYRAFRDVLIRMPRLQNVNGNSIFRGRQ